MAAYTSSQAGNWSSLTTWQPDVGTADAIPGNGDTVTISHAVDVDENTTVGTSPAAGNNAIVINRNSGGKLTVKTGYKLTYRGDITLNDAWAEDGEALVMEAGSTLEHDSSQASSPSTTSYGVLWEAANQSPRVQINGTSGSRCTVTSNAGGANGYFGGTSAGQGQVRATYCDFSSIGDSSTNAFTFRDLSTSASYDAIDFQFSFANCTFDGCGTIKGTALRANNTFSLTDCTWTNTEGDHCIGDATANFATAALTTGTRDITGCVFDEMVRPHQCEDFTVDGNVFLDGFTGATGYPMASFSDNVVIDNDFLDIGVLAVDGNTSCDDNYWFKREKTTDDNPHFVGIRGSGTSLVDGWIFEYEGDYTDHTDTGDIILFYTVAETANTIQVKRCISIPSGDRDRMAGCLLSLGGNTGTTVIAEHNTAYQKVMRIGEAYAGHAGIVSSFKSNIVWDDAATSYSAYKCNDISGTVQDAMSSSVADYNCGHNHTAGDNLKGYDGFDFSSGSPGANDVDVNPQFVDDTRNFADWDDSLGGAGTAANAIAELAKLNDGDFDSNYTVANLLAYVRGGFAPQNSSLEDAGHDSVTIGAVEGSFSTPSASPSASPSSSPSSSSSSSPSGSPSASPSPSGSPSTSPSPSGSPSSSPSGSPSTSPSASPSPSLSPSEAPAVAGGSPLSSPIFRGSV